MIKIVLTVLCGTALLSCVQEHNYEYIQNELMYSLKTDAKVQGHFYILRGRINERDYYVFYVKDQTGGYVRKYVPVDQTIIYGKDSVKGFMPHAEYPKRLAVKMNTWSGDTLQQELHDINTPEDLGTGAIQSTKRSYMFQRVPSDRTSIFKLSARNMVKTNEILKMPAILA